MRISKITHYADKHEAVGATRMLSNITFFASRKTARRNSYGALLTVIMCATFATSLSRDQQIVRSFHLDNLTIQTMITRQSK